MVVKVKNPPQLESPSTINRILVNVSMSEAHRLKKNRQSKTEHQITKNDNETTIEITNLEPEETYNISVSYVTKFGYGEPSDIVQVEGSLDILRNGLPG